ncbi:hypothetical protein Hanom_Chr14g01332451 [Helianthus anomalus]
MAASPKNDILIQFSKFSQANIDRFCSDNGIDQSLSPVVPSDKVPASKCLEGKIVLYTRILEHSNIRYEPLIKMFRQFFRLARNGSWFTIEKTQFEEVLIIRTVGFTSSLKDRFFSKSDALIPFCHFHSELESESLLKLCASPSKLRSYLEEFLVLLGISANWFDSFTEPSFVVHGKEMSDLDFMLFDDLSDVEMVPKEVP